MGKAKASLAAPPKPRPLWPHLGMCVPSHFHVRARGDDHCTKCTKSGFGSVKIGLRLKQSRWFSFSEVGSLIVRGARCVESTCIKFIYTVSCACINAFQKPLIQEHLGGTCINDFGKTLIQEHLGGTCINDFGKSLMHEQAGGICTNASRDPLRQARGRYERLRTLICAN